ncbi:hypothetical protein ACNKHU_09635 [Shigella flexneri]
MATVNTPVPGEISLRKMVSKLIGYTNLPGRLPTQSSAAYGTNLVDLLKTVVQRERRQCHC